EGSVSIPKAEQKDANNKSKLTVDKSTSDVGTSKPVTDAIKSNADNTDPLEPSTSKVSSSPTEKSSSSVSGSSSNDSASSLNGSTSASKDAGSNLNGSSSTTSGSTSALNGSGATNIDSASDKSSDRVSSASGWNDESKSTDAVKGVSDGHAIEASRESSANF